MSTEPTCNLCGHSHLTHRFRLEEHGGPICTRCPNRTCQAGPDGERGHGRMVRLRVEETATDDDNELEN